MFFFRREKQTGIAGVPWIINIPGLHSYGIKGFRIEYFVDCTLHTLDLGLLQRWIGASFGTCLSRDVFHTEKTSKAERVEAGILALRAKLKALQS